MSKLLLATRCQLKLQTKMKLILVESPTKSKTISKFLGPEYKVMASFGHVRDLPKSKMGVDVEHDFEPKYLIPAKAKKVIAELKEVEKKAEEVIYATDEDREGESIAWHLAQALKHDPAEAKRIVFHEITKSAIEHALEKPRHIDMHLVDAQQARRILDRLVGYELSPFLWRKVRFGLSAGRVQSVAVRLVVEREREIQKFVKEEYWTIEADLAARSDLEKVFRGQLIKISDPVKSPSGDHGAGKELEKFSIKTETEAKKIETDLAGAKYQVADIQNKSLQRHPAPPFTTSTLQQEAARKLGFSAKQTMTLAQQLYETGLITYMRTDSVNLAEAALQQAKEVVTQHFGKEYALAEPRHFKTKSKGAQEAHEAIRPTNLAHLPEALTSQTDRGQARLYDLIWKRTLACQMQPADIDHTTVLTKATNQTGEFVFKSTGQVIKFDGFIRAYTESSDEDTAPEDASPPAIALSSGDWRAGTLPPLKVGEGVDLIKLFPWQHFTEPPGRYSDATLIKALEAHGVGRPSTYAPTLTTIQDRGYVEKIEKKYQPTEIGNLVNDLLVENFPEIIDIDFTSHIEEEFDQIAEGELEWVPVIREFYTPFKKHLEEKEVSVEKLTETSTTPCPHCGQMMLIKFGRMGKFLACPEPGSKITQPLPEEAAKIQELTDKTKDERCPLCSKAMTVRRGRFGYFLGCSDYPKCKGIAKIWEKTGFKCPACLLAPERKDNPGDIVERKGRGRAKVFYACNRFPACNFLMNQKPANEAEVQAALVKWQENPPKPSKRSAHWRTTKKKTDAEPETPAA